MQLCKLQRSNTEINLKIKHSDIQLLSKDILKDNATIVAQPVNKHKKCMPNNYGARNIIKVLIVL